jgi:HTH-type transcriptional regulator / antitoxin HigA
MKWGALKTKIAYEAAVNRALSIFHAEEGSAECEELKLLLVLIKEYEESHIAIPAA